MQSKTDRLSTCKRALPPPHQLHPTHCAARTGLNRLSGALAVARRAVPALVTLAEARLAHASPVALRAARGGWRKADVARWAKQGPPSPVAPLCCRWSLQCLVAVLLASSFRHRQPRRKPAGERQAPAGPPRHTPRTWLGQIISCGLSQWRPPRPSGHAHLRTTARARTSSQGSVRLRQQRRRWVERQTRQRVRSERERSLGRGRAWGRTHLSSGSAAWHQPLGPYCSAGTYKKRGRAGAADAKQSRCCGRHGPACTAKAGLRTAWERHWSGRQRQRRTSLSHVTTPHSCLVPLASCGRAAPARTGAVSCRHRRRGLPR